MVFYSPLRLHGGFTSSQQWGRKSDHKNFFESEFQRGLHVSTMRSLALQHLWHCQHIASFTFLKMREKEESNVANEWYRSLEESCQLSKSLFMSEIILDDRMYVLFFFLSSWECSKCEAEWINDRKIHQICSRCLRVASVWFVKCVI